mgnify:CR=1 FL=1
MIFPSFLHVREKTNRGKSKEDKGNQRNYKRNRGPQNSGREKVVFFCSEGWNCCRRQENRPGFDVHHQARLQDYFGHPWPVCSFQINLSPPFFFGSDLPLDDLWASCSKSISFFPDGRWARRRWHDVSHRASLMKTNLPQLEVLPHPITFFFCFQRLVAHSTGGVGRAAMHLHKVVDADGSQVLVEIWYTCAPTPCPPAHRSIIYLF